jgi:hypothetical protein
VPYSVWVIPSEISPVHNTVSLKSIKAVYLKNINIVEYELVTLDAVRPTIKIHDRPPECNKKARKKLTSLSRTTIDFIHRALIFTKYYVIDF